jgi:hypothetical protein
VHAISKMDVPAAAAILTTRHPAVLKSQCCMLVVVLGLCLVWAWRCYPGLLFVLLACWVLSLGLPAVFFMVCVELIAGFMLRCLYLGACAVWLDFLATLCYDTQAYIRSCPCTCKDTSVGHMCDHERSKPPRSVRHYRVNVLLCKVFSTAKY